MVIYQDKRNTVPPNLFMLFLRTLGPHDTHFHDPRTQMRSKDRPLGRTQKGREQLKCVPAVTSEETGTLVTLCLLCTLHFTSYKETSLPII